MREIAEVFRKLFTHGFEYFGRYYSTYRAIVFDTGDPENMGRLRLIIPEVAGDTPYQTWAFSKGMFSGVTHENKPYGIHILPKKGDIVWVEFERGNPSVPIWQHGYPGTNGKPFDVTLMGDDSYWFITPNGHTLSINDTNNTITVKLKSGQSLVLDTEAISVVHNKKISLGSEVYSSEPAVLGDTHNAQMKAVLQSIAKITVMTPLGPSSIPLNTLDFTNQIEALPTMLSQKVSLD